MFKISVGRELAAPDLGDPTQFLKILLHLADDWSAIGRALGHFSIAVEVASMCDRGIIRNPTLGL